MKFESLEEKFNYYAIRALQAKERGDYKNYIINLKIATSILEEKEGKSLDELIEEELKNEE